MIRKIAPFLILGLLAPGAAIAQEDSNPRPAKQMTGKTPVSAQNLRVQVTAKYQELEGSADFVVGNGSQANHVAGGDQVFVIKQGEGEGAEFKKWGFLVNILPVLDPRERDAIQVQLQIELSGPVKGEKIRASHTPNMTTWQWQSSFTVPRGRKTVLVTAPARVELTIDIVESR